MATGNGDDESPLLAGNGSGPMSLPPQSNSMNAISDVPVVEQPQGNKRHTMFEGYDFDHILIFDSLKPKCSREILNSFLHLYRVGNRKDDPGFTYPSGKPRYIGIGGGSSGQETNILATATLPDNGATGSYQSDDRRPLLNSGSSIQVNFLA